MQGPIGWRRLLSASLSGLSFFFPPETFGRVCSDNWENILQEARGHLKYIFSFAPVRTTKTKHLECGHFLLVWHTLQGQGEQLGTNVLLTRCVLPSKSRCRVILLMLSLLLSSITKSSFRQHLVRMGYRWGSDWALEMPWRLMQVLRARSTSLWWPCPLQRRPP